MRILHVIPSFAPAWRYGGPIVAADGLTRTLADLGHEVTVFTTNIDGDGVLDVQTGAPVNRGHVRVWYFPVQRPRWYYYSAGLAELLRRCISEFNIVHIHSVFLWPTTIASFWCRKTNVPYIIRPAGLLDPACIRKSYERQTTSLKSRLKKHLYLTTLGRLELGHASAIHFTTEAEMREAVLPHTRARKLVVPLGVETFPKMEIDVDLLRHKFPQLFGRKVVLFLSRLDRKKGIVLLMKAAQELMTRRNDFVLAVAGQGSGDYETELERLSDTLGIRQHVVFTGAVSGAMKQSLLRCAHLFALPSYHENFGVAAVEAMAAGLPIIISDRVNIHPEVTRAGAGLVIGLNTSELAAALTMLLDDDVQRRRMGQNGQALVESTFTWDKVARMTVSMYESVIARGNESAKNLTNVREYSSTHAKSSRPTQ